MFHSQLTVLEKIPQKNSFPENFIDRHFKLFLDRIHAHKEKVPTVEKKPLRLVLPTAGATSLQKSSKGILNFCKSQVVFKSQTKPVTIFS